MNKYKEFAKVKFATKRECSSYIDIYESAEQESCFVPPDSNGMGVRQDYVDLSYDEYADLYEKVRAKIIEVNVNAGWNFKLTDFHQPLRISKYKKNYSHDWHLDYVSSDKSKIAFSCLLNDQFDGGKLQALEVKLPKVSVGDAIVFPAYHGHRVTRIVRGTRYVLLAWYTGPRFV